MARRYDLGRRRASVDRTASAIVAAARAELEQTPAARLSLGAVARRAGVTRATVYKRFGSRDGLIRALVPDTSHPPANEAAIEEGAREALHRFLAKSCSAWGANPALYRNLPPPSEHDVPRRLAERLAGEDRLRPGCSLKEAQDVIGALASFAVFDQLHQDGRRSPSACAEILVRLAGGILG